MLYTTCEYKILHFHNQTLWLLSICRTIYCGYYLRVATWCWLNSTNSFVNTKVRMMHANHNAATQGWSATSKLNKPLLCYKVVHTRNFQSVSSLSSFSGFTSCSPSVPQKMSNFNQQLLGYTTTICSPLISFTAQQFGSVKVVHILNKGGVYFIQPFHR